MTLGFLTTRVGRRFLAVNLLTALVPVTVVIAVSFSSVRSELREQSEARVRRLGKSVAMTTLSYLTTITLELPRSADGVSPTSMFEAIGTTDTRSGVRHRDGRPLPLQPEQLTHLESGRPLLLLDTSGGTAEVMLARTTLPVRDSATPVTWARVRPAALFDVIDETVEGEDAKLCIFEAKTLTRIHCAPGVTDRERVIARERARRGGVEADERARGDLFLSARDIFLHHDYGAAEWRVVVLQPADAAFAGAANFRTTFLLLALALIILIFAVSHAQIRRATEPLFRLQDGTRRLQAGDFTTPVLVQGDDEYAAVAASFNGMAFALHRQITLMQHLDAVDQSALGTRDSGGLVDEALGCIAESLPCRSITIAIVNATDQVTLDLITHDAATRARARSTSQLSVLEHAELLANSRQLLLTGGTSRRNYLPAPQEHAASGQTVVLPLVKDQTLVGAISLHLLDTTQPPESWAEARRLADRVALALSNVQLLTRLDALSSGTVLAFARAIDANSPWTAGHSERVTRVALQIGHQLQLSATEMDTLERGGLLHDIGKIAVPPTILDKTGTLSDEEWSVMRRHPVVGCEILSPIPAFTDALPIVRWHHERMDGTGYPDRLLGDEIPYLARILAVADVFDALASDRPYRAAMTTSQASAIIQQGSGAHFDPHVVHAFLDAVCDGRIEASTPEVDSRSLAASVARARKHTLQPA